jgi:hypothetical protein
MFWLEQIELSDDCNLNLHCAEGSKRAAAKKNLERLGEKIKVTSAYDLNAVAKS